MKARCLLAAILALVCTAALGEQPPPFSTQGLEGWDSQSFRDPETLKLHKLTKYSLVDDGGTQVLAAQCDDAGSAEAWASTVDLTQTPVLHWRWKVDRIFPGLDERVRGGSDFPARVYVAIGKRWLPWTLKSLIYVWANGERKETSWPSPYSGPAGKAIIVPVRSGAEGVGTWQPQARDVRADFKQYFDLDIDSIGGVAVVTDCDDAHGQANSWFGDLQFEAH